MGNVPWSGAQDAGFTIGGDHGARQPPVEQSGRVRRTCMAIRTVCFVAAVPLQGWARWTAVLMAVLLPYFAVVMANAVGPRPAGVVEPVEWSEAGSLTSGDVIEGQVIPPDPARP